MNYVLTIWLFFVLQNCHSQVDFLSCGSNGELIKSSTTGCCEKSLGIYDTYVDIAVTPNGTIYGLNGDIFEIDTASITSNNISTPLDQYGNYSAGVGLVAYDDNYLISDRDDSLFLIEINTGSALNLGKIGYYCNGDFAFYKGVLYMSSSSNELIKISLDPISYYITSVDNIGVMSPFGGIYSLFTTYDGYASNLKSLFAIEGYSIYKVNTSDASLELICNFDSNHGSFGGASIYDFENTAWDQKIPNIFTPNNDGINDYFIIPKSYNSTALTILNRWGNMVYEWTDGEQKWNGNDQSDKPVSEGIYFYLIEILDCNNSHKINGSLTLLK